MPKKNMAAYKTKNMSAQEKVKLTSQLFVLGKKLNKLNNKNEPKEK